MHESHYSVQLGIYWFKYSVRLMEFVGPNTFTCMFTILKYLFIKQAKIQFTSLQNLYVQIHVCKFPVHHTMVFLVKIPVCQYWYSVYHGISGLNKCMSIFSSPYYGIFGLNTSMPIQVFSLPWYFWFKQLYIKIWFLILWYFVKIPVCQYSGSPYYGILV